MKKTLLSIGLITLLTSIVSCGGTSFLTTSLTTNQTTEETTTTTTQENPYKEIDQELLGNFKFFKKVTNLDETSAGYGLSQDRLTSTNISIASTGFQIASYPIYVEMNYLAKDEASKIVEKTFDSLLRLQNDENENYGGCFFHFLDKESGNHINGSEISTIDTAILLAGVITAMEYFDTESISAKGNQIWSNIDYTLFEGRTQNGGKLISMGADKNHNLLSACWDMTAEQLMMYVFGAGNPNTKVRLNKSHYDAFNKPYRKYNNHKVYYTWNGSIFTYQFSHAFIDFEKYDDPNGINWWSNSIEASLASYEYSVDNKDTYEGYSETSWGLTACDTPLGYSGELGALPRGGNPGGNYADIAGTIAPCGALGSIMFTPEESLAALKNYHSIDKLNDASFGLRDAYCLNFNNTKDWYDDDFIGIDKGIENLMLYSYRNTKFIQNLVMGNKNIVEGLTNLGFVAK